MTEVQDLMERGRRLRAADPALATSFFTEALLLALTTPTRIVINSVAAPYRQQGAHTHGHETIPCYRIHFEGERPGEREPKLSDRMLELMGRNGMTWEDVIA